MSTAVHRRAFPALVLSLVVYVTPPTSAVASPQANATTPGLLSSYSTLISAGFEWRIDGDDDRDCSVTLEYRRLGESAWRPAQPLHRVERDAWTHGESPGNLLAGSLFFLAPGTDYEARLTLSDPDGGSAQQVVAFATRRPPRTDGLRERYVVPGSGGGSGTFEDPFRGLAAADAAAQPGDLFIVGPGTYAGPFVATRNGEATAPIVYRGIDASQVTIDGGGGISSGSHCVVLDDRRHVTIEGMRLVNALRPVNADDSEGVTIRRCFIEPKAVLLGTRGIQAASSRDLFIAHNTVMMPGQWESIGRTGDYGTGGYAILIEGTGHVVCFNTIVESWDAISMPVTDEAVPTAPTSNVDIYGNFVDRASDDGVQADAIRHNVRIFRNRLLNTGSAMSFQPAFGGPGYLLFNEVYNTRIEPYKFHQETYFGWTQETSGFRVYHNTTVCNRQAWYETGIWRQGHFRNNVLMGGRSGTHSLHLSYDYAGADFDFNGYNRVGTYLVRAAGADFTGLTQWFAASGNERNGAELGTDAFVDLTLPHHPEWNYPDGYGAPYGPNDNDLRLLAGSAATDRGQVLWNINDGFTGLAPDLGCYEGGSAVPRYGPRPAGAPLVASASATASIGPAPLTVIFVGTAQNTSGVATAFHWDFGDGSESRGGQSVTHTFDVPGTHVVTLEVIDADGDMATAQLEIDVTDDTVDVTVARGGLRLGPIVPNPMTTGADVHFTLPRDGRVELDVCDISGRRVRNLFDGELQARAHRVRWDGRDQQGASCAPGLYFARLETESGRRVVRMVLIP